MRQSAAVRAVEAPRFGIDQGLGHEPILKWVNVDELKIDHRYQRDVVKHGEARIKKIATEFSWRFFGALSVGMDTRNNLMVLDGQHRLLAAKRRGVQRVPCVLLITPELADQAMSFVTINRDRASTTPTQVFWAGVAAGHADDTRLLRLCTDAGVKIARHGGANLPAGTTSSLGALRHCLRVYGAEALSMALTILKDAKPQDSRALGGTYITAVATLCYYHGEMLNRDRLVRVISEASLPIIQADVRSFTRVEGRSLRVAMRHILTSLYNKGLHHTQRLDPEDTEPAPPIPDAAASQEEPAHTRPVRDVPRTRKCINCRRPFKSEGFGHRQCKACKSRKR